jgi:uncharacterized membrane protein YfcA
VTTGIAGRSLVSGAGRLPFWVLAAISVAGGVLGAVLLLATPESVFSALVPWLVLFATGVFAWGSFVPRPQGGGRLGRSGAAGAQFCISIYGGYFGGGIGFLMLAAFTAAGIALRVAGATKNVLAAAMNASAVAIFLSSPEVRWVAAGVSCAGAVIGGIVGGLMLHKVNERVLRVVIVMIGLALTVGLFLRA